MTTLIAFLLLPISILAWLVIGFLVVAIVLSARG